MLWKIKKKVIIAISLIGFILIIAGLFLLFEIKKDSANGRLFIWKISVLAIAKSPVKGHGCHSFSTIYGSTQEEYFSTAEYSEQDVFVAGSPEYAFNEYLQIAVEYGILFLVLFVLFIGYCLFVGIKKHRIGVCGSILSVLVFAFSSYPFRIPVFVITFVFLIASCIIGESRYWLSIFALVIGLSGFYIKQNDVYGECCKWKTTRMLYQVGAYDAAIKEFEALYIALKDRPVFLFEYGHACHKTGEYQRSIEILLEASSRSNDPMIFNVIGKNYQLLHEYSKAEYYFNRSVNRLPGRIYPYYLLVKLYNEPDYLHNEKMNEMAEMVLTKKPKVQSTAIEQMKDEVREILKKND